MAIVIPDTKSVPYVRWMIRRDMVEVMTIEQELFSKPWTEEDFYNALRSRNCIGIVAEIKGIIVGYMVYEFHKRFYRICNIAVQSYCHRRGVATALINKLKSDLKKTTTERNKIKVSSGEDNLDFQLFLKANGFECYRIIEDRYKFRFKRSA